MIQVVCIDKKNRAIQKYQAEVTLPGDAVIVMKPGVPPLGSAEFDAWLEGWNERHTNPVVLLMMEVQG